MASHVDPSPAGACAVAPSRRELTKLCPGSVGRKKLEQQSRLLTLDLQGGRRAETPSSDILDRTSVCLSVLEETGRHRDGVSTSSSAPRGTPYSTRSAPNLQLGRHDSRGAVPVDCSSSSSSRSRERRPENAAASTRSLVSSLLMPDGVTVRAPAKLGISSGDPIGTHILKRRTSCLTSETFSPAGPFTSRLNLSLHRRSLNSTWHQTFRSSAAVPRSRRSRRPADSETDLLPKLTAFSPSLNRALSQDIALFPVRTSSDSVSSPSPSQLIGTPASDVPPETPLTSSGHLQVPQLAISPNKQPDSYVSPVGKSGDSSSFACGEPGATSCVVLRLPPVEADLGKPARLSSEPASVLEVVPALAAGVPTPSSRQDVKKPGSVGPTEVNRDWSESPSEVSREGSERTQSGVEPELVSRHGALLLEEELRKETAKYEAELSKNPRSEDALYQLGVLQFRGGKADEAIRRISEFLRVSPTSVQSEGDVSGPLGLTGSPGEPVDCEAAGEAVRGEVLEPGHTPSREGDEVEGGSRSKEHCLARGLPASSGGEVEVPASHTAGQGSSQGDKEGENRHEGESYDAGNQERESENQDRLPRREREPKERNLPAGQNGSHGEENPVSTGTSSEGALQREHKYGSNQKEALRSRFGRAVPIQKLFNIVLDRRSQLDRRAKDLLAGWGPPVYLQLEKLLGHLWFEQENYAEALRHYWRCVDICPDDGQLFTNLGLAYYETSAMKEATAAFEHAIKLNERDVTALSVLAMLLMDEFAEEEEAKLRVLEEQEEEVSLPSDQDRLRHLREGTERCATMLKKCLEIDKNNILAQLHLAQVYMYREEWDRCEEIFEALLEENADDTHILNNLGQVAMHKGDTEGARKLLGRVLEINPEDELAHMHMCELLCKDNEPTLALEHFKLCCESSPDSVSLHATCGLPLCEVGKEKEVIAAYTNFIKKHPDSAAARAFKRSLGSIGEDVGFFESTTIVIFIVLPIVLLIVLLLACAHFFSLWPASDSAQQSSLSVAVPYSDHSEL